jgi:SPP1 family predicted phage head-tail adaptor
MRSGPLDQRLTILTPVYASSTQSSQGVATFHPTDSVWGSVLTLSSDETLQASSVGSQTTYSVEIRHRTDVTPKHRLQWTPYTSTTARTLEVLGVSFSDRRSDRLVLRCGEVQ